MREEFSAGGVVYKKEGQNLLILVAQHSHHHGWVFPKGLIGDEIENEGKEETAIREVKEETGVDVRILKELSPVSYWYVWEEKKVKKTVYYYLMVALDGDITKHDEEMEKVEWIKDTEVDGRLTYPSDKKVWNEAREMLK